jgi:hypothetical protein
MCIHNTMLIITRLKIKQKIQNLNQIDVVITVIIICSGGLRDVRIHKRMN